MRFVFSFIILLSVISAFGQTPAAQSEKAKFMVDIIRYVRWENRSKIGKEFTIGVVRDGKMAKQLRELTVRKTILGKKVEVVEFYKIDDIKKCDMLYLSNKVFVTDKVINFINGQINGHPTLIISDRAERVAMINFFVRNYDNGIIYEVNKRNMTNAGIIPNAGFLKRKDSRIKENYP